MPNDASKPAGSSQFEPLAFDSSVAPAAATCTKCGTALRGSYHMIGESMACGKCRYAAESQAGGATGAAPMIRAVLFGAGAAIVGAGGYYAFVKITNIEWALLTALVGLGVGMAVRIGSRGHGGQKYQIVATVLTYFAMSGAYLPFILEGLTEGADAIAITPSVLLVWLVKTPLIVGLASPISGLFIVYALYRAWKSNAGEGAQQVAVSGPFRLQQAASPDAPTA